MTDYSIIKYVTGSISLAALIALVAARLVLQTITRDIDILKNIRGSKEEIAARERVAALLLERFVVETSDLSSGYRRELALKQLDERRKRTFTVFAFAGFVCLCAVTVAIVAIINTR